MKFQNYEDMCLGILTSQPVSVSASQQAVSSLKNACIFEKRVDKVDTLRAGFSQRNRLLFWVGKPPALPVEVPRKKALASSIERSELLTANYQ